MEFKKECQTREVHFTLAAPENQEMSRQVEVTWRMLCTIAYSLMVYANNFGSVYSFHNNLYNRSYLSGSTNQGSDKQGRWFYHAI